MLVNSVSQSPIGGSPHGVLQAAGALFPGVAA